MSSTMNTTTDVTDYDIHFSTVQVILLGTYCFFMTIFGICGNGVVIYSSIRYNAINLDKISLIFVQNLAIADILYTLTNILPLLITYIAGRWVLGPVYCFVMSQLGVIPGSANTLTVLTITSYRLRLITSPFSNITVKTARVLLALIWSMAMIPAIVFKAYNSKSEYHAKNARCVSDIYENDAARIPVMVCVGFIVFIPLFAITISNVILSVIAVRHSAASSSSDRKSYRALVMVCALSGLFIISWTPYLVYTFMKTKSPEVSPLLDILSFHCIFLNSFGNPILYSITNRRFGMYVKGVVVGMFGCSQDEEGRQMGPMSSTSNTTKSTNNPGSSTYINN